MGALMTLTAEEAVLAVLLSSMPPETRELMRQLGKELLRSQVPASDGGAK